MLPTPKASPLPRIYAWFSAVITNDIDLLSDLLTHGIPIDVPHPLRHSTALMEATRRGCASTVQWLLEHGASPAFLCGTPQSTALHCALRRRHWAVAENLIDAMPTCAVIDANGATALHALCADALPEGQNEQALAIANQLIANDCPLDVLDREGTTALHHCVVNDLMPLASLLLMRGANANALIPDSKVSPLAIAALEKNLPMAQLLIHYGADCHTQTREGSTPASIYPALMENPTISL